MNVEDQLKALNFSWVEDRKVAGSRGPRTPKNLKALADAGIRTLIRLASNDETGITAADVESCGLSDLYEPIADFNAPTPDQIDRLIEAIAHSVGGGKPVGVSCNAGHGRTGTLLACYLISRGRSATDAIDHLISLRPGSSEIHRGNGQENAILDFERRWQTRSWDRLSRSDAMAASFADRFAALPDERRSG